MSTEKYDALYLRVNQILSKHKADRTFDERMALLVWDAVYTLYPSAEPGDDFEWDMDTLEDVARTFWEFRPD